MQNWPISLIIVLGTVIYCEFIADYIVLQKCEWPQLDTSTTDSTNNPVEPLRAMIIADTHLLGPHRGHWLDKLYREWHMAGAFQAAARILRPEVVFVLGDLFDEGDMVSDKAFQIYVHRFWRLFRLPAGVPLISIVGNHDIGFHYRMHPYFTDRFKTYLNNTGVHLYSLKRIHFLLINSMAMEDDDCFFCAQAKETLEQLSVKLDCMKHPEKQVCRGRIREYYSAPILLQHFPTYRSSDKECQQHDAPEIEEYRENWHVLSKQATDLLGKLIKPRLAFAGHSHHYCHSVNRLGIDEYTVASFNWRNKINPSFMLATLTPTAYKVSKCDMLQQQNVFDNYAVGICSSVVWFLISEGWRRV